MNPFDATVVRAAYDKVAIEYAVRYPENVSRLVVPVVHGDEVAAVVVCERYAPGGFDASALDAATAAVSDLVPALAGL